MDITPDKIHLRCTEEEAAMKCAFRLSMFRCSLKGRIDNLPDECKLLIDNLDKLFAGECQEVTDYGVGIHDMIENIRRRYRAGNISSRIDVLRDIRNIVYTLSKNGRLEDANTLIGNLEYMFCKDASNVNNYVLHNLRVGVDDSIVKFYMYCICLLYVTIMFIIFLHGGIFF
ncbi:hypothetical protein [Cetacean poxvirus 1]|nr:hypothetical protein [Cetacean poxvirus 1]QHG62693.1 hypothetical protein [Cetacean poxvirus 1]